MSSSHQPEKPPVPGRLRLLLILGGITAIGPVSIDAYLPAFPQIADDLHASESAVQLTLATFLVFMAVGQLTLGPLSDSWGRRRPVLIGLSVYALASLACAAAPSVETLMALRAVQGLAGAAGVVIARAVVRDLFSGSDLTRFFARLTLVFGLGPIVAPTLGSLLLEITGWRGIFVMLSGIGTAAAIAAFAWLPETLPAEQRRSSRVPQMARTMGGLLRDRRFVGYSLAMGLGFGGMFAYISSSSFVLQEVFDVPALTYGVLFGANALGFVLVGQLSAFLAGRVPEKVTLTAGLGIAAVAGAALVTASLVGVGGVVAVAGPLFVFVASLGLVMPNATALALSVHPESAGSGSALLGFLQAPIAAVVAPLVGLGPANSAVPMALAVAVFAAAALFAMAALTRGGARTA
ncbi:multidrug effflux MFS transporter [Virgisporangium ochraceum]|uniref:Bcr/CflA family drug resistance efflux transporter n=1 Tax=Virgisporangium ochraceum TaxID=65505 RepID=A0A8J4EBQ0_9ACTN|nr:multidrug effflux MFS transporter [Virgisporangium ochraceum]GIJ68829.1 Bcr/CflA family drug resistance efflux transporter [Virgisporangium ochraceum]